MRRRIFNAEQRAFALRQRGTGDGDGRECEEDGKDEIMLTIDGKEIRDNVRRCRSPAATSVLT